MSANAYHIISIVGFVMAAVLFLTAVVLFFVMDIRGVINDLSGKTAARQIAELRNKNYSNSTARTLNNVYENYDKPEDKPVVKVELTKTSQMTAHDSKRLDQSTTDLIKKREGEEATSVLQNNDIMQASFDGEDVTTMLASNNDNTGIFGDEDATTVLSATEMDYMVLGDEDVTTVLQSNHQFVFNIVYNIISVHTEDIIM